ncbi:MAG: hypothetical protein BM557_01910 [Flavobacterium sp. MedPE-SWcel]|uniref:hypothetical protein n=1 Tax=uncultured Flavobacterium sp. TaxID=165435 RepID=UPI0009172282|nr:hypothetical protein [uncultured Flavobacterium sp.]OIQ22153.1 MAG: hypothetical protein BM557_01910 [Flavobacterium sp. MedPE-SWcel]
MPTREPRTQNTTLAKNNPFGKVFGNKLLITSLDHDLEMDMNNIRKIRLYNTTSYLYNAIVLGLGIIIIVLSIMYSTSNMILIGLIALGIAIMASSFLIRRSIYNIVITLKENDKVIKIPVKKGQRKEADDFTFYVNGEILRLDKSRYNHHRKIYSRV